MPTLDRRTLLTGTIAAGIGTATLAGLVAAQDATPDATTDTTTMTDADTADLAARLTDHLALLQADLDTVRTDIDATTIDTLVSEASTGIAAIASADEPRRHAAATATLVHAAGLLLDAQLEYAGLPSQQARSSRVLERSHTTIADASDLTSATTDTSLYTATAQTLYADAYDLYGASAWAQAATTARAAETLAAGATILLGTGGIGPGRNDDRGSFDGGGRDRGNDASAPSTDDSATPVTVPAPDFVTG